jgi:hypothetical protein
MLEDRFASFPVWCALLVGAWLWGSSWMAGEARVYMRSWIPSWRFFENTGDLPVLEFSIGGDPAWIPIPNSSGASSAKLWFSPAANAFHAFETLVLDFALDPAHPDLESCLLEESVRRVLTLHPDSKTIRFRLFWVGQGMTRSESVWERAWNSPRF